MSTTLLFGAGAVVTFITLWGVLMSVGLFVTRHQPPDDAMVPSDAAAVAFIGPILVDGTWPIGEVAPPIARS